MSSRETQRPALRGMRMPGSADCTRGVCRCSRSYRPRQESPTAEPLSTSRASTPFRRRVAATARPAGPAPTTSTGVSTLAPTAPTLPHPGPDRQLLLARVGRRAVGDHGTPLAQGLLGAHRRVADGLSLG